MPPRTVRRAFGAVRQKCDPRAAHHADYPTDIIPKRYQMDSANGPMTFFSFFSFFFRRVLSFGHTPPDPAPER